MRSGSHHRFLLAALFVASLSLRPQIVGVGPLLPSIRRGLNVSHSIAGLLPTVVVLCMGVFAPAGVRLARRYGARPSVTLALALIALFGVARALVGSAAAMVLLTLPVGFGVAVAGSLMPAVVKDSWPERPVFATGVYTTGISLGAALSAAVAVPLASIAWGWRGSLVVLSGATFVLLLGWLVLTAAQPPHDRPRAEAPRIPWRNGTGWRLVAIFTLTSVCYYGVSAWLPAVYVERGWSDASAGALITVVSVVTLPASLIVAWLGDHVGSRRIYLTGGATVLTVATLGVLLAERQAWLWAVLIGIWVGVTFPSVMTLPLDLAPRPAEAGAMTAMMLGVGYTLASAAPFLFGAVRDLTGDFTAVLWLIVAGAILLLLASASAPHR